MKFLIVLSVLAAFASAKPGFAPLAYSAYPGIHTFGYSALGIPTAYSYNSLPLSAPLIKSINAPAVISTPAVAVGIKTQYHTQDLHGQASYGHSEPSQSHDAVQDAHGNKVGSFSYVAPSGQVFRTDYIADALGYRVSSNALPVSPHDTPEVAAARADHLAHHHYRAKRGIVAIGHTPASTSPLGAGVPPPVSYTASLPLASPLAYSTTYTIPLPHAYTTYAASHGYLAPHLAYFH